MRTMPRFNEALFKCFSLPLIRRNNNSVYCDLDIKTNQISLY